MIKRSILGLIICVSLMIASGCNTATSQDKSGKTDGVTKDKSGYPQMPQAMRTTEQKLLDGKSLKLEDKKGKVLLVNLWATWCGPCKSEMPFLVQLQEEYQDKDFEIIGLNVGYEPDTVVKTFIERYKINYTVGFAEDEVVSEMMRMSQRDGIPKSFIINKEGKVVGIFSGFDKGETPQKIRKVIENTLAG